MRRPLLRLLAEHNPFYLLSALCMLSGCYILGRALALEPGQTAKLLVLLATLNVYEGLLIVLALFLLVRRRLERDGRILLVIETLFIADTTFLNGECFASDLATGVAVSGVALSLAALKVAVVFHALDPERPRRGFVPVAIPLALLFATPGVFGLLAVWQLLTPAIVYAAWWIAALTMLVQAGIERSSAGLVQTQARPAADAFRRALVLVLPVSLALHLAASAWVYDVSFHIVYLGPVLVALGAVCNLLDIPWLPPWWRLGLPAAGVIVSLGYSEELLVHGPWGLLLSPLRASLLAAGLTYLLGYWLHRTAAFAWGAGVCLAGAVAGHSVAAIAATISTLWRWARAAGRWLVPKTAAAWGVTAVSMAFVLLALGGLASLFNARDQTTTGR